MVAPSTFRFPWHFVISTENGLWDLLSGCPRQELSVQTRGMPCARGPSDTPGIFFLAFAPHYGANSIGLLVANDSLGTIFEGETGAFEQSLGKHLRQNWKKGDV